MKSIFKYYGAPLIVVLSLSLSLMACGKANQQGVRFQSKAERQLASLEEGESADIDFSTPDKEEELRAEPGQEVADSSKDESSYTDKDQCSEQEEEYVADDEEEDAESPPATSCGGGDAYSIDECVSNCNQHCPRWRRAMWFSERTYVTKTYGSHTVTHSVAACRCSNVEGEPSASSIDPRWILSDRY